MESAVEDIRYEKIRKALGQLRPYLEEDGGDITLVDITDDNVARVELHGACVSCSMSMMTLKAGVEDAVKKVVPEIESVIAINLT